MRSGVGRSNPVAVAGEPVVEEEDEPPPPPPVEDDGGLGACRDDDREAEARGLPALDPPLVYWTAEEGWPGLRGCRCQTDAECAAKEEAQRERFAWCYRAISRHR